MKMLEDISSAAQEARQWLNGRRPELAIVLGSGFSGVLTQINPLSSLAFDQLPGFPASGVSGHAGQLHFGTLFDRPALIFQGRYHVYEGYSAWQVTAPVRLAAELGCRKILLTNAAGGIHASMLPGGFMLVTDHVNFTGLNPLIGRPEREFIDLSQLYSQDFYPQLSQLLKQKGVNLHRGVLAWMTGPSYETPAEIRMLEGAGADAVSMSIIPEAIIACHFGLDVVALSLISNFAAGKSSEKLQHADVLAIGRRADTALVALLQTLLPLWS